MKSTTLLGLCAALALAGCKHEESTSQEVGVRPSQSTSATVAEVAPALPAPVAASLSPEEPTTEVQGLPVPEVFEEEAEKTIDPSNLEAELDCLEAEIVE